MYEFTRIYIEITSSEAPVAVLERICARWLLRTCTFDYIPRDVTWQLNHPLLVSEGIALCQLASFHAFDN